MAEMLERADLVLSIVPPGLAARVAGEVAESMTVSGFYPPYADCNAVSPETAKAMAKRISNAGADFIDGGILGPPPREGGNSTRFYFSGDRAELLSELDGKGIVVRLLGPEVGRASGIKMCYAALTKGTHALQTAVITLAEALGLTQEVSHEFQTSQKAYYQQMNSSAPRLPVVAWRYIDEMKQIAQTFETAGVTPKFHQGAAGHLFPPRDNAFSGTNFREHEQELISTTSGGGVCRALADENGRRLMIQGNDMPEDLSTLGLEVFREYRNLADSFREETNGLSQELCDLVLPEKSWGAWSIKEQISHTAWIPYLFFLEFWPPVLYPDSSPRDKSLVDTGGADRMLDPARFPSMSDVMAALDDAYALCRVVLSKETLATLRNKELPRRYSPDRTWANGERSDRLFSKSRSSCS